MTLVYILRVNGGRGQKYTGATVNLLIEDHSQFNHLTLFNVC